MAFNSVRFDLSSFNIDTGNVRYFDAVGVEKVSISIGTNLLAFVSANGYEQVRRVVSGASGRFPTAVGTETIDKGTVESESMVLLACVAVERLSGIVSASADMYPTASGNEIVSGNLALGQKISLQSALTETVTKVLSLGQKISLIGAGYEFVAESASLEAIDIKTCYIGNANSVFNLAPGQKLVIDADRYNVLVNDNNAIHLQSGDWIDELNLETINIAITASAGSSNLVASILYTEKYL